MSGNSYQKNGGVGVYHEIPNGTGGGSGTKKKTIIGVVVLAAVAIAGYVFYGVSNPAGASVAKVMEKANLEVNSKGRLKLFDKQSTWLAAAIHFIADVISWLCDDALTCMPRRVYLFIFIYRFLERFVTEDFDAEFTFSSFLPGVAGYFGRPVWAFYVNRGQAISTFGTESKDYPILEFNPANKAYQVTPFVGFRTFVRGTRSSATLSFESEPFTPSRSRNLLDENDDPDKPKRILYVGTNEVEIQELDGVHGLTTNVQYFIMPEENFAALVRRATFTNSGDSPVTLDILDGLAKMEPAGGRLDWNLKNMGRYDDHASLMEFLLACVVLISAVLSHFYRAELSKGGSVCTMSTTP